MADMAQIFRPIPRRAFDLTPASTNSSVPPSPPEYANAELLMERKPDPSMSPSRTRSILNLTSSTLFGIYSPTGHEATREEISTPWGTGAQTPSHRPSMDESRPQPSTLNWNSLTQKPQAPRRRRPRPSLLQKMLRTILLFCCGVGYGAVIAQLHSSQKMAPVRLPVVDGHSWYRHLAWGLSGVLLGNALPWMDTKWDRRESTSGMEKDGTRPDSYRDSTLRGSGRVTSGEGEDELRSDWLSAVRSIGAFVGIAFAVRKLPWQSTLQVSTTLAMANPFLWYLIDRSKAGFAFSTAVGIAGTVVLLVVNPELVPLPAAREQSTDMSERIGVFIWMASILFCTSLCFGAIGRKVQS